MEILAVLMPFCPLFSSPTFTNIQLLFVGAVLTPGQRTITSCLRGVGLEQDRHFTNFHRVLNRSPWSAKEGARLLFWMIIRFLVPSGPILLGLDDTIERRRGEKIKAKGIYRDPVRSSHGHFVKCSGLRWLCLMVLAPIPFAKRVWALPFLTVLCPSVRYYQQHHAPLAARKRVPKKLTDWARQLPLLVRRWIPERPLIVVADASFAVLELLACWRECRDDQSPITAITRLRLDAALFEPAAPYQPGQTGRPRKRGQRLPTLRDRLKRDDFDWIPLQLAGWYNAAHPQTEREVEVATATAVWSNAGKAVVPIRWVLVRDPKGQFPTQALLCTDLSLQPQQILGFFLQRWQLEVTFREAREHLGLETQRQWNDRAIERTTPLLLALFSLVTLIAHQLEQADSPMLRQRYLRNSAWYHKQQPTFSDALAWVRRNLWMMRHQSFLRSVSNTDLRKFDHQFFDTLTDMLCYAT
ncbi:MAG: hypothetical protein EOP09_07415 [Proteobacteria bacterium]|nr:MAG: hypothetical protein EOP09_07415 [Pseudomonadota bacterium]